MLGSIGFSVRRKRCITVVKPSNSKGAALVGVVKYLSGRARKAFFLSKISVGTYSRGRVSSVQLGGVKFIFRDFRLLPGRDTLTGIRVPLGCTEMPGGREERHTLGTLSEINLTSEISFGPGRLSKNRVREITVTETVIGGPGLLLTSRPANTLSDGSNTRIVRLFRELGSRKMSMLVVARSTSVTTRTGEIIAVGSNVLRRGE